MINIYEVTETNNMVEKENLDVTHHYDGNQPSWTASIPDLNACLDKIYKKITESAKDLVKTGEEIAQEFGVPIVNKRISVTPIALVGGAACKTPEDFAKIAEVMDKAAHEVGVNFIGGYSALVNKGMTHADELLIRSIPMALSRTERCLQLCQRRFHPTAVSTWMLSACWAKSSKRRRSTQRSRIP